MVATVIPHWEKTFYRKKKKWKWNSHVKACSIKLWNLNSHCLKEKELFHNAICISKNYCRNAWLYTQNLPTQLSSYCSRTAPRPLLRQLLHLVGSHWHIVEELQTHFLARFLVCPCFSRGDHDRRASDFSKIIFKAGLGKKPWLHICKSVPELIAFATTLKISF